MFCNKGRCQILCKAAEEPAVALLTGQANKKLLKAVILLLSPAQSHAFGARKAFSNTVSRLFLVYELVISQTAGFRAPNTIRTAC